MIYRDDIAALQARYRALDAELTERTRERDEVARLLAEAHQREQHERVLIDAAMGGPARRRLYALIAGGILMLGLIAAVLIHREYGARDHLAETITQYARFADDMCRCHDSACARQTMDEMSKWTTEAIRDEPPSKPDRATMQRLESIARQLTECATRAMTSGSDRVQAPYAESQGQ